MLTNLMLITTIDKLTVVHMHPAYTPTGAYLLSNLLHSNERNYLSLLSSVYWQTLEIMAYHSIDHELTCRVQKLLSSLIWGKINVP